MTLSFPSRIGDKFPASSEAPENLMKLLRTDGRGRKDQVATRVAVEYFQRMKDLRPGYFTGVASWAKGGLAYGVAGTITAAAIGLAGWGTYLLGKKAYDKGYGVHVLGALAAGGIVSRQIGFNPLAALATLLGVAVRDSADRAAKWSVKQDEKSLDAKQRETIECKKEIFNQLMTVYNDCAKNLTEQVAQAERNESTDDRLQIRRMADTLENRLPEIENLLGKFELGKHEIESVLQRLKDRIRFVQHNACKLEPKKTFERLNAELIVNWPTDSIHQIAVPAALKERIAAAQMSRLGIIGQYKEHGRTALAGAATLVGTTAAVAAIAFGAAAYQHGAGATFGRVQDFVSGRNRTMPADLSSEALIGLGGVAALSVVGPTTAVVAKKTSANARAFQANANFVEGELAACRKDLKTIYDGVKNHVKVLSENRWEAVIALQERLPAIREEIQKLGIVEDPSEILGGLERGLN